MYVLCTFKIKIESLNWIMAVSKTSDYFQIIIRMPNPSQEPPASSKAPNVALKDMDVLCTFTIKIKMPNPSQEPPASSKAPNEGLKDMDVLCTFKIKIESQIWNMCVLKTTDHIQINIRIPNPSQEPPAPPKAPNEDLKDMDVLCTFKDKIESQNFEYRCIKGQ